MTTLTIILLQSNCPVLQAKETFNIWQKKNVGDLILCIVGFSAYRVPRTG